MKKHLLAIAALWAISGAWAQSSVTLYGVADMGIGKTTGRKTGMIGGDIVNNLTSFIRLSRHRGYG